MMNLSAINCNAVRSCNSDDAKHGLVIIKHTKPLAWVCNIWHLGPSAFHLKTTVAVETLVANATRESGWRQNEWRRSAEVIPPAHPWQCATNSFPPSCSNHSYSSNLPTFPGTATSGRVLLLVTQNGHGRGTGTADSSTPGTDGASAAVVRRVVRVVCVDTWGQGRGGRRGLLLVVLQGPLDVELQDSAELHEGNKHQLVKKFTCSYGTPRERKEKIYQLVWLALWHLVLPETGE